MPPAAGRPSLNAAAGWRLAQVKSRPSRQPPAPPEGGGVKPPSPGVTRILTLALLLKAAAPAVQPTTQLLLVCALFFCPPLTAHHAVAIERLRDAPPAHFKQRRPVAQQRAAKLRGNHALHLVGARLVEGLSHAMNARSTRTCLPGCKQDEGQASSPAAPSGPPRTCSGQHQCPPSCMHPSRHAAVPTRRCARMAAHKPMRNMPHCTAHGIAVVGMHAALEAGAHVHNGARTMPGWIQ